MHFSFTSKLRWTLLSKFVFNFLYNVFTNLGNSHWTQTDPLETKMIVLREIKISTLWNELPPVFHRQEVHLLDRTYTYIGQLPEVTRHWTCKLNIFTVGSFSFANWLAQDLYYHHWPKTFGIIEKEVDVAVVSWCSSFPAQKRWLHAGCLFIHWFAHYTCFLWWDWFLNKQEECDCRGHAHAKIFKIYLVTHLCRWVFFSLLDSESILSNEGHEESCILVVGYKGLLGQNQHLKPSFVTEM